MKQPCIVSIYSYYYWEIQLPDGSIIDRYYDEKIALKLPISEKAKNIYSNVKNAIRKKDIEGLSDISYTTIMCDILFCAMSDLNVIYVVSDGEIIRVRREEG